MSDTGKRLVQQQFANKVAAYATSALHARGESLRRLVELAQPEPEWVVLDVGTGAGHTAFAFAPHVRRVMSADLTFPMLREVETRAGACGWANVHTAAADAEVLPFASGIFDLVTCRLAAHHFPEVDSFVRECARVLCRQGTLALVDNVVLGSTRQNMKGQQKRRAGRYVNAFEKLRDPSHQRCLTVSEWRETFYQAGFALVHEEVGRKKFNFDDYVTRMEVPPDDVVRLQAMLVQAPADVLEFLTPVFDADTIDFYLSEAIFVVRKTDTL